jgi:hypothetical protein
MANGRNLRGGLKVTGLGAYQEKSPTCYANEKCEAGWRFGVKSWEHVYDFFRPRRRQKKGETGDA